MLMAAVAVSVGWVPPVSPLSVAMAKILLPSAEGVVAVTGPLFWMLYSRAAVSAAFAIPSFACVPPVVPMCHASLLVASVNGWKVYAVAIVATSFMFTNESAPLPAVEKLPEDGQLPSVAS